MAGLFHLSVVYLKFYFIFENNFLYFQRLLTQFYEELCVQYYLDMNEELTFFQVLVYFKVPNGVVFLKGFFLNLIILSKLSTFDPQFYLYYIWFAVREHMTSRLFRGEFSNFTHKLFPWHETNSIFGFSSTNV